MFVVDAQVHIADEGKSTWRELPERGLSPDERLLPEYAEHNHPDISDLMKEMEKVSVDAVILVPNMVNGEQLNNETCISAAREVPSRFAVMGRISPTRESEIALLDQWMSMPEMLGVRVSLTNHQGNLRAIEDGSVNWLWSALEERNVPVMLNAPGLTEYLQTIATRHPMLRIVIDHLGMPAREVQDDLRPLLPPVLSLAKNENVTIKASMLPGLVSENYPFPLLKETMREVIGAFGEERVFFGSDLSRLPCRYGQLVDFFRNELDFLSDQQLALVMGAGIVRFLGWEAIEPLL